MVLFLLEVDLFELRIFFVIVDRILFEGSNDFTPLRSKWISNPLSEVGTTKKAFFLLNEEDMFFVTFDLLLCFEALAVGRYSLQRTRERFLSEEEVVGSLYVARLVSIYTVLYSLVDGVASTMMVLSLIGIVNGYMC